MPLMTGSLSSPKRQLTSGYDREARKLLRSGNREAANALALAGSKERLESGSIKSAEEEVSTKAVEEAIARRALAERAGREKARAVDVTPAAAEPTTEPAAAAKPAGRVFSSEQTAAFGRAALAQEASDKEGRGILRASYDKLMSENDAKSEALAKEGAKAESFNKILSGGTAALEAAAADIQSRYPTAEKPAASATGGLEGTLKELAAARAGNAALPKTPPKPTVVDEMKAALKPAEKPAEKPAAKPSIAGELKTAKPTAYEKTMTDGFVSLEAPFTDAAKRFVEEEKKGYKAPLRSATLAAATGARRLGADLLRSFR